MFQCLVTVASLCVKQNLIKEVNGIIVQYHQKCDRVLVEMCVSFRIYSMLISLVNSVATSCCLQYLLM